MSKLKYQNALHRSVFLTFDNLDLI